MNILYIFYLLLIILPISTIAVNTNRYFLNYSVDSSAQQNKQNKKECIESIKEYDECMKLPEGDSFINLDVFCITFQTPKCKSYIDKGFSSIRGCSNDWKDETPFEKYHIYSEIMKFYYKIHCTKDENNEYCPIGIMDSNNRKYRKETGDYKPIQLSEKQFYMYINNTCILDNCREAILSYKEDNKYITELEEKLTKLMENNHFKRIFTVENFKIIDEDEIMDQAISYLKSDECLNLIKKKNIEVNMENGTTVKYSFPLLLLSNIFFTLLFNLF